MAKKSLSELERRTVNALRHVILVNEELFECDEVYSETWLRAVKELAADDLGSSKLAKN